MELAIIEKEIVIVQMDNKPKEYIALEQPKLRDYPLAVKNTNTAMFIDYLLNLLGVSSGKAEHHVEANNFINSQMGKWSYEEMRLAFEMFVSDKLGIEPYQQLNAIVIGKVMKAYQVHLNRKLAEYERLRAEQLRKDNEPTEEEKEIKRIEGVKECYNHYLKEGFVAPGNSWVYDRLKAKGILKPSKEKKELFYILATINTKKAVREDYKPETAKGIIKQIEDNNSGRVINEAKRLWLEDYYKTIKE